MPKRFLKAEDLPNDPDKLVELYEEQMDLFNSYSEECERIERDVGPFSDSKTGEEVSILSKSEKELTDPEELARDVIVSLMTEQHTIWHNLQLIQMDALIREIELPEQKTDQAESAQEGKKETGIEISEDDTAISEEDNVFVKRGDFWIVKYQGQNLGPLDSSIGMRYISYLLMHQGQQCRTPLELEAAVKGSVNSGNVYSEMTQEQLAEEGLYTFMGTIKVVTDDKAVIDHQRRLKERLDEIAGEMDEARYNNDLAQIGVLQEEKEWLLKELRALALQAKYPQKWDPANEKARKRIWAAVDRAIESIREHSDDLANHLRESLTPFSPPYNYHPNPPIDWST